MRHDDMEPLENSSENLQTDLETDFDKHDDGIAARHLKTTTRREMRTKSGPCVTLQAWYVRANLNPSARSSAETSNSRGTESEDRARGGTE